MNLNKKKIKEVIQDLLTKQDSLKDNDERLAANVLHQALKLLGKDPATLSAYSLLQLYADNKLPTIDYITRVRRKLQESNPDLRGEAYAKRKQKAEEVKRNINKTDIDEVF